MFYLFHTISDYPKYNKKVSPYKIPRPASELPAFCLRDEDVSFSDYKPELYTGESKAVQGAGLGPLPLQMD